MTAGHLLEVKKVSMDFGGIRALDQVDLTADKAEILGIIGSNGSGKSTLINIITGIYRPVSGQVLFDGTDITGRKPYMTAALGIVRTFQNLRIFGAMSVKENVMAGLQLHRKSGFFASMFRTGAFVREEKEAKEEAERLLEFTGLKDMMEKPAQSLSYGQKKKLEIARALACHPRICILDEPVAGMDSAEAMEIVEVIKNVRETYQTGIILIEHNIEAMMAAAGRILVMDTGRIIAEGTPTQIRQDPAAVRIYFGGGNE